MDGMRRLPFSTGGIILINSFIRGACAMDVLSIIFRYESNMNNLLVIINHQCYIWGAK